MKPYWENWEEAKGKCSLAETPKGTKNYDIRLYELAGKCSFGILDDGSINPDVLPFITRMFEKETKNEIRFNGLS